jgi:chromatin segregation and condensation protein Rec8/ScpA/Scc1 (kleisin family)
MTDGVEATSQEYFRLTQFLLMDFQFIEEGLKMYIARAYEIVRMRTRGFMPFELDYDTVAQEPLGRLVSRYSPLTENKLLVERLKKLQTARNECAHRAFLLTYDEQHDHAFLSGEVSRLEALRQETRDCVGQVLAEVKRLSNVRARLDGSV